MTFYDDMADMAVEVLAEFQQGTVQLKRVTVGEAPNEWTVPQETEETFPLSATVRRIHQRYENGVLIVETGDQVLFAVPAVEPLITDTLIIDGAERAITNLTPIPAAGTPLAWKAWCKA
jgi:hypothetical protein